MGFSVLAEPTEKLRIPLFPSVLTPQGETVEHYLVLLPDDCHFKNRVFGPPREVRSMMRLFTNDNDSIAATTNKIMMQEETGFDNSATGATETMTTDNTSISKDVDLVEAPAALTNELPMVQRELDNIRLLLSKERLYNLPAFTAWDMTTSLSWNLSDIYKLAPIANVLGQYNIWRAVVCSRVEIVSDPSNQGFALLALDSRGGSDDVINALPSDRDWSGVLHLPIDLRQHPTATLRAPWNWDVQYSKTDNPTGELLTKFRLVPIVPVTGGVGGQTVDVRVHVWLEDVQLGLPRPQSYEFGVSSDNGAKEWAEEQKGVDAIVLTPTIADIVTWNTTNVIGENIATFNPSTGDSRLARMLQQVDTHRGDLVLQLFVVGTAFHRGVLSVGFTAGGSTASDLSFKSTLWDIAKNPTLCVRAKYCEATPLVTDWRNMITMNVVNPLKATSVASDTVQIVVYAHYENFRFGAPDVSLPTSYTAVLPFKQQVEPQGYGLSCEEGVEDLVFAENERVVVGKTLQEYISEEYHFSNFAESLGATPPSGGGSRNNVLCLRPFAIQQETGRSRDDLLRWLLSNFFFHEGCMTMKIRIGNTTFDNVQGTTTFQWNGEWSGGFEVIGNYATTYDILNADIVPTPTNIVNSGLIHTCRTGDTFDIKIHSNPAVFNNRFLTRDRVQPTISLRTDQTGWRDAPTVIWPALVFSRKYAGALYGLRPVVPPAAP